MALSVVISCSWLARPQAPKVTSLPTAETQPPLLTIQVDGTATPTPFQPGASPTLTATLAAATDPPPTASPTPSPTFDQSTWPPPNYGTPGPTPVTPVPPPAPLQGEGTINIMLIGSDRRTSSYRTDALILLSVRPQERLVTLISIPRDLFVYIPGWTMQRINTAYQRGELTGYPGGGPGLLKDTVRYNLGVRVDHFALVEFEGFQEIIDTLGGIDLPLTCPYTDWHIKNPKRSIDDPDNWKLLTVGPGLVHMDGELALWYDRSRLRSSDFDRGRRQQEVLRAVYARGLRLEVIPRLPQLYAQFRQTVETDLSLDDVLGLAPLASNLGSARVRSYYINRDIVTSWRTPQNAAVLLPKPEELHALILEAVSAPDEDQPQNREDTVEIWNGTDEADWDALAAERLHYAGYATQIGVPDHRDYVETFLYDLSAAQDPERAANLLESLGLAASRLVTSPDPSSPYPYRLVLGEDYQPCFDPSTINQSLQ
jgi:LCP family protein required for cell wall assembly